MLTISRLGHCCFRSTSTSVVKHLSCHKVTLQTCAANTVGKRCCISQYSFPQTSFKYFKHWQPAVRTDTDAENVFLYSIYKTLPSLRSLQTKMDISLLLPPNSVRGMTTLKHESFERKINVPYIRVKSESVQKSVKLFKKHMLKIDKLKPVQTDEDDTNKKVILLNPLLVKSIDDILKEYEELAVEGDTEFLNKEITLGYENWKAEDIIKAILPENQEGAQGYSLIGHILHLNLREHVLPYKTVIGEVLLEKIPNITLVVNKTNIIDTTYRNFEMEILAGMGKTDVMVKENGCSFSFDFAKVYWNPRLATEHERITRKFRHGDILYDVMAGVGPFAVPCGKKKCRVLANDLNPHSYEALVKNCSANKVNNRVICYNLDGNEFIKTVLKKDLQKTWSDTYFVGSIHVTMNLPAMAVEFLPSFIGIFSKSDNLPENPILPMVHVYMFIRDTENDTAIAMVSEKLGYINPEEMTNNTQNGGTGNDSSDVTAETKSASMKRPGSTEEKADDTETKGKSNGITPEAKVTTTVSCGDVERFRPHVNEVVFVRGVAPNKNMMRVSFKMPLEVLTGNHTIGPPAKKLKIA